MQPDSEINLIKDEVQQTTEVKEDILIDLTETTPDVQNETNETVESNLQNNESLTPGMFDLKF